MNAVVSVRAGSGPERRLRLGDCLDGQAVERAHRAAIAWIKALRHVDVDGEPMRDRFVYRGDSLWWFTELYLHKREQVLAWHAAAAAWLRLIEQEQPASIGASASAGDVAAVVGQQVARRAGVAWHGRTSLPPAAQRNAAFRIRARYLTWSAIASRHRGSDLHVPPLAAGGVLAFVHSAFWRDGAAAGDGDEQYVGPVLRAIEARAGRDRLALVGVGPRTNFRARRWWHAAVETGPHGRVLPVEGLSGRHDIRASQAIWRNRHRHQRALLASPALRAAALIDGCDVWPLLVDELEGVTWMQWPWSARAMDEAGAALDRLAPSAVLTYAEAGGWGRAIVLEARRRGVPSVGVQHGFIYRHWMNYLHAPDEFAPSERQASDAGFPAPTRTLLFDEFARRHLSAAGHFPADRLIVTGSPGQQALRGRVLAATAASRASTRASLRVSPSDRVVVVVTKHAQMRRAFPALVDVVSSMPDTRLVVKCHPAETAEPYEWDAHGSSAVTVLSAASDLAALLSVASAVVTVNSTVAIDAMTLGIPALIVELPNNLSPFVEAGVMAGATSLDTLREDLPRLIEDTAGLAALRVRQRTFLAEYGGPPEDAAARAAEETLRLAGRG
jgi:hypothetical protein